MTAIPWPDHLLTLDEWDTLPQPEMTRRLELLEGVLLVVPRPTRLHQRAMVNLAGELDRQLPDDLTALADSEVVVESRNPATVRVPDVVVVPARYAEADSKPLDAADVVAVVEIISPGTRRTDQVTKRTEYADAGIPHYWVVDIEDSPTLTALVLVDGEYEVIAEGGGTLALLDGTIQIDVDRLTARR